MTNLPKTLLAPDLPENLNANSQWLAGEGAGSWFQFDFMIDGIEVKRFDPYGVLECEGIFAVHNNFDPSKSFEITYPSHCAIITVLQKGQTIRLNPA